MGKVRKKPQTYMSHKLHVAKLTLKLQCEWEGCQFETKSMPVFTDHIEGHFGHFLPEGVTAQNYTRHRLEETDGEIKCLWEDCDYASSFPILHIRHLYYHLFHTKVKARGRALQDSLTDIPQCQLDRQTRNMVHEVVSTFYCQWADCEYYTDNMEAFVVHVDTHTEHSQNGLNGIPQCQWTGCTTVMLNKYILKSHIKCHTQEKRFGCDNCGNMYGASTKLVDHLMKQVPIDEQNFQCSHCSKIFANHRLLRDHVRRHVNHYKCPLCNMTCNAPANLRQHILYRHSVERPWPCEICGQRFCVKGDLTKHLQTHAEMDAFWCDFEKCTFKARTSTALRRHFQREHLEIDVKRYCCHVCSVRYTTGRRLSHHLKNKHKFKCPSGFNRFRYREHEDGLYRLQTIRYESLEITEQFLVDSATTEGINQPEPSHLEQLTPIGQPSPMEQPLPVRHPSPMGQPPSVDEQPAPLVEPVVDGSGSDIEGQQYANRVGEGYNNMVLSMPHDEELSVASPGGGFQVSLRDAGDASDHSRQY